MTGSETGMTHGVVIGFRLLIVTLEQAHLFQCKILNVKQLYHQVLTEQLSQFSIFIFSLIWIY
jgi:hypothetical protein